MECEILHTIEGDRKKSIDTSTEKGRQETAVFLNRLLRGGTAIFLECGKKAYRVKAYDPKADLLTVSTDVKGQAKDVKTKGRKAEMTAVPPIAGG